MGAIAVDRVGSLSVVVSVVLVFSVVVIVGCFVGIGIIVRRVVVLRIRPARMLAFSSSKSMRCGGRVMGRGCGGGGVALVVAGGGVVGVIGCVVGISVFVGIIVRKVIWSRIKPSRMLAFNASKSMRCGGGVMGW